LRDALVLLELEDNQVVELYRGLQKASVVDGTRDRDAGQGLAEDLLRDVGVRHVGVDEAAALLKRRPKAPLFTFGTAGSESHGRRKSSNNNNNSNSNNSNSDTDHSLAALFERSFDPTNLKTSKPPQVAPTSKQALSAKRSVPNLKSVSSDPSDSSSDAMDDDDGTHDDVDGGGDADVEDLDVDDDDDDDDDDDVDAMAVDGKHRKHSKADDARESLEKNKRSVFIGNLPVETARSKASVAKALELNGKIFEGKHLRVDKAIGDPVRDLKKSVFLGNLSFDVSDESIWSAFAECGEVKNVRVIRDKSVVKTNVGKGFGYVQFADRQIVPIAIKMMNGKEIEGRPVRVTKCSAESDTPNKLVWQRSTAPLSGAARRAAAKQKLKAKGARNTLIHDALAQSQFAEKRWVWVHDKTEGYLPGWIVEEKDGIVLVEFNGGSKLTLNVNDTEKMNPPKFDKVEDMASLTYLNEASVIHNLRLRYFSNLIYTYSGLFLVAVNPYKKLLIYNDETIKFYKSKKKSEAPPHIYAIADAAYHEMIQNKESQSVLITGESGAGKTENTKKVIQYITAIAPSSSRPPVFVDPGKVDKTAFDCGKPLGSLEHKILQANPILESFGNAQTIRNNNSSRFGKFIRLEFNPAGQICSANIERYLLEKSRVTHQTPRERNYHIFYQLLKGADSEMKAKLLLNESLNDYAFIKDSKKDVESVDDIADFKILTNSMDVMKITREEQLSLFRVISAILNLGNIQVVSDREDQAQLSESGHAAAEKVCHVLGIPVPEFTKSLLRPKMKAGRDWVTQARSVAQVLYSVEALSRALYERMFGKLVDRINEAIGSNGAKSTFIGVLDIAGFEIFEQNSFEQLCINYTNEKLQQFFNHHMFIIEQEEYQREGIEWKFIDFGLDLQPTIDLIEKTSPIGVLSCLDEECVMPKATDKTFLDKLHGLWKGKSAKYEAPRFNTSFTLQHYAGKVEYDTSGWLDKNKDPLNENITRLLSASNEKFIATLFADCAGEGDDFKSRGTTGITKKGAFRTVGQRHKEQLLSLMGQLYRTEPHFVRCIVPNEEKKPGKINVNQVLDQLRCNGVLEGIRICRAGFPNRLTFADFRHRYELLSPGVIPKGFMDGKSGAQLLLESLTLDKSQYRIGNSKVFFRNGVLADLEERRDEKLEKIVTRIQAIARGYISRRRFKKLLDRCRAIRIIQKNSRIYVTLREWPWWKLYTKVKPLLNVARTDEELRQREELAKEWEDKAKKEAEEKAKLEQTKVALESKMKEMEEVLIQEKSAAANQAEILARTQQREVALTEQLAACAAELEQKDLEAESAVNDRKALELQLRTLNMSLKDQKDHMDRIEKDRLIKEDQISDLEAKIKSEAENSARYEHEKKSLEKQLAELQSNFDIKVDQVAELLRHQNKLKESLNELEQRLELEQEERKRLEIKKSAAEAELQKLTESHAALEKLKAELENSLKRKENENASINERLQSEISERQTSEKTRRGLQSQLSAIQNELAAQTNERDMLKKAKAKLEFELDSMSRLIEEKGSEEHKQGEIRKLRELEFFDVKNQLANVLSEMESLRKTSGMVQDKLTLELDSLREEMQILSKAKANAEKQCQELIQELEKVEDDQSKLEKSKRQLEAELAQSKSEASDLNSSIVELKLAKETVEAKVSHLSVRLEESESSCMRLDRERQSMSRQLAGLQEEYEEEKKRSASLVAQNKRLGKEISDLRIRVEDLSVSAEETSKKLSAKAQELDMLHERYNQEALAKNTDLEETRRKLDAQTLEYEAKVKDLEGSCANLEKTRSRMNAELEDLRVEVDREHNAARNMERLFKTAEAQLLAANGSFETLKKEKESLERTMRSLQQKNGSLAVELEEKALQMSSLLKSKIDLENEFKSLINEIGDNGKNVHELDKAKRRLESRISDLESQLEEEQETNKQNAEQKAALETQLSDLKRKTETDLRFKDSQMDELRRLLLKEVNSLGDQLEESQQQKSELSKQKKKLEEQLQELSSRAESSAKGQSDFEKYKKKMETAVKELQAKLEDEEKKRRNSEELSDRLEKKSNALQTALETLEMQVESAERAKKNADKKIQELAEEIHGASEDSKINLLESKKRLEREVKALKEKLNEEEDLRVALESEKMSAAQEIEVLRGKAAREADFDKIERLEEARRALVAAQRLAVQDLEDKIRDNENLEKQKKVLQAEVQDLRANIETEIAAKLEESAARRKLALEVKDLQAKLEAETVKSTDISEIISGYKSRLDLLAVQLESSELAKMKAEKMECNLRSQVKELEDRQKVLETQRRDLDDKVKNFDSQISDYVAKQEDSAIELTELKLSRKRLQEELASLQDRKAKEIEEQDMVLDHTRKKFQKEIKQLIADLDAEKELLVEAKETNNELEQEIENVSNKLESEMRQTASLKKEKQRLELKVEETLRQNIELSARFEEQQNAFAATGAQMRELKANLEDAEAQRGVLEKAKRVLEARLDELAEQYSTADRTRNELTRSVTELDQKAIALRDSLEELQDTANISTEKLRRTEQMLVDSAADLSKERETVIETERARTQLEKQVKELNTRVFELESLAVSAATGTTRRLEARVSELMTQLEAEMAEKSDLQKTVRKLERSAREMQFNISEKEKQKLRVEDDMEKLEQKLKKMKAAMEELEASENSAQMAKRKAEREAAEYRDRSLRLERDAEKARKTVLIQ
ncbi:hypothetical protein HDU82_008794, partial [Entophlyctis luteolus]